MTEFVWKSPTGRRHSLSEIAGFEAAMGVRLPDPIKAGHLVGWDAQVFKDGQHCFITQETANVEVAVFYGLTSLKSVGLIGEYRDTYSVKYGVDLNAMIPFGENGDLFVCLDYRCDPEAPAIYELYMDEDEGSPVGYYKVADTLEDFLTALSPGP